MNIRTVKIISNNTEKSQLAEKETIKHIKKYNIKVVDNKPDLVIAIGGDGAFINSVHKNNFDKNTFYVGIHTGHLGFLQEIDIENIEEIIEMIVQNKYRIEKSSIEEISVCTNNKKYQYKALNEIIVREKELKTMYFDVLVNGKCLEHFAGDGLCISTSTGSTAYNLSLGGSIMYPEMNCLQLLPIAPINSAVYKSLRCGVVVPENMIITIIPKEEYKDKVLTMIDGIKIEYDEIINKIEITSKEGINVLRFDKYDFWTRINDKLL